MIDKKTENLGLPLPHPENQLSEDVGRIQLAFAAVDAALYEAATTAGTALTDAATAQETAEAARTAADDARSAADAALENAGLALTAAGQASARHDRLEGAAEASSADGADGASVITLDGAAARVFSATVTAPATVTAANVEPGVCLLLILTNGGAHALTWGMAPRWPNGEAPSLTADGTDLVTLLRAPDGWYGVHAAAACA